MNTENKELKELFKTIENIINSYEAELTIKRKECFENDEYAYSLCDDYKSRKTKNVVIHMINKNINILYFKDEYKNIIFVNFLRLCQLNNLDVKKYHDLFLKYDIISLFPNFEKHLNYFLKPVINNDKLLWDINKEYFELHNLKFKENCNNNNDNYFFIEDKIKNKMNNLLENSSNDDTFSFSEENSVSSSTEKSSIYDDVDNDNITNKKELNNNESFSNSFLKHLNENKPSVLEEESNFLNNKLTNEKETLRISIYNKMKEDIPNKKFIMENIEKIDKKEKNVFLNLNNINLNHLIDSIVSKDNECNSSDKIMKNSLGDSLVNKFVKTYENENEEINNLHKKINGMEKIIKHLMNEIIKRDLIEKKINNKEIKEINFDKKETEMELNSEENNEKNNEKNNEENNEKNKLKHNEIDNIKNINTINIYNNDVKEVDKKYFDSYNYTSIHRTMILDKSRTNCYYEFIYKNKEIFKNKVVLDIGCGSSIISLFCSDYASIVVGIDNAKKILNKAKKIAEKNKAKNIFLFEGKLEDNDIYIDEKEQIYYLSKNEDIENFQKINNVQLKLLKFDIIISEWMGYFLFYECMINTILYARDIYLKENGYIFPNKINLYICGYNDLEYINENILIWEKPLYNKDLSELKPNLKNFMENVKIMNVDKNKVSTEIINFETINLYTYRKENFYINSNFEIPIKEDKIVTSLCFYFDCIFETSTFYENVNQNISNVNEVKSIINSHSTYNILTTSMFKEKTHWKQTLFHLHCCNYNISNIFCINKEQINYLCGNIYVSPQTKHSRNINVVLQIKKNKLLNINEELICCYSID
ncbi:histone-arginine methyltransferase, putative [Plasmodium gallinaceum]|uniref:Histone-arginine methyltransferase, putative n=1 Tax=Plasmodium gallinaceum TaxID=5849 RepID=A0A1J1H2U7_PLAGA|nr:histone-arginine methyltransferase, putative [Plasmodium gallinaceum]CRG97670.1 histone-arginine methyltransferase, putative [Plasmodium gallinaceum]